MSNDLTSAIFSTPSDSISRLHLKRARSSSNLAPGNPTPAPKRSRRRADEVKRSRGKENVPPSRGLSSKPISQARRSFGNSTARKVSYSCDPVSEATLVSQPLKATENLPQSAKTVASDIPLKFML